MDTQPFYKRSHPMVPIAAASVLVMSLIGIGVFTGILPNHMGSQAAPSSDVAMSASAPSTPSTYSNASMPATNALPAEPTPAPAPASRRPDVPAPYYPPSQTVAARATPMPAPVECVACGKVTGVRAVQVQGKATGVGAVAGGVGGALLGNQFGSGNGRTAMTILGAAGGAFAGNTVEKHVRTQTAYRVDVRMDDGTTRSFPASGPGAYSPGERVRVENGALVRVG
jgi:outer membrane lipoprotein SlyB